MKDLTIEIEEKAKRYDEVIERANSLLSGNQIGNAWIYKLLPELKESEDERMIKFISNELACLRAVDGKGSDRYKELTNAIAWLEKQCEQDEECKEINLVEILKHYPKETELFSPLYGKLWLAEVDEKNEIITCYKHHLEKGCTRAVLEQEDSVSFYSNGTTGLPDFSISKDCMLFLYDKEKQGEQKPVDKIEPKFKVGNWVVYCNEDVDLITGIEEKGYRINEGGYIPFACEDDMHLWTIQDAKDGDVLASCNGCPFVYKKSDGPKARLYYCVSITNNFCIDDGIIHCGSKNSAKPATKEQRDILFSKMKEAGYEWDAEKKELKKIEQKLVWNKDDDRIFDKLMKHFDLESRYYFDKDDYDEARDWVKSIKERMQMQPMK